VKRFIPLIIVLAIAGAYGYKRYRDAHAPFEWSGTVEAHTITIGSRAGGRVKLVKVREGDEVKPNQPIVELEPGDWPAQLAQAQAAQAQAEAQLDKLVAGSRPEEIAEANARTQTAQAALAETNSGARPEEIAAARARVVSQDVAVEKAQHDADRMHKLDAAGAAVKADVDNANIALKGAIALRDAAREQLAQLVNGSRREDIAQAQARKAEQAASLQLAKAGARSEDLRVGRAQVDAAKARVAQLQTMIDELVIRAPPEIKGARVEALDLRPGDILGANAPAATLLEESELYVRIYVPETELGRIAVGQPVPVRVDTFPDETFAGTVEHINMVGEYSPRNLQTADERADQVFAARVDVPKATKLRAGMAAFIRVPRE
jgi:multidrug resistance efflux pump